MLLDHTRLPEVLILSIKADWLMSVDCTLVPGPGSKSTVPLKNPVTYTFPAASVAMKLPRSMPVSPKAMAHWKLPAASSLEIKISFLPAEARVNVPAPGSKSAVPSKCPVVYTLPAASVVMELPASSPAPPMPFAQARFWDYALITTKFKSKHVTNVFMTNRVIPLKIEHYKGVSKKTFAVGSIYFITGITYMATSLHAILLFDKLGRFFMFGSDRNKIQAGCQASYVDRCFSSA